MTGKNKSLFLQSESKNGIRAGGTASLKDAPAAGKTNI
jgi:hypothetical protein